MVKGNLISSFKALALYWKLLGSGVLCMIFAFGFYLFQSDFEETSIGVLQHSIESQLQVKLKDVEDDMKLVRQKIPELPNQRFTELNDLLKKPIFLYKNGQLFYWNYSDFIPPNSFAFENYKTKVFWNRNHKYILQKDTLSDKGNTYVILGYQLIEFNYTVKNRDLPTKVCFPELLDARLSIYAKSTLSKKIQDVKGKILFYIDNNENEAPHEASKNNFYFNGLILLTIGFLLAAALSCTKTFFVKRGKYQRGLLLLVLQIGITFEVLKKVSESYEWYKAGIFGIRLNTIPLLGENIGTVLVNLFLLSVIIGYFFRYFLGSHFYLRLLNLHYVLKLCLSTALIVAVYLCFYFQYQLFRGLIGALSVDLDVATPLYFSEGRFIGLIAIIYIAFMFFMATHLCLRLALTLTNSNLAYNSIVVVAGMLFSFLFYVLLGSRFILLIPAAGVFSLLLLIYKFPKYLGENRYQTYLYLFIFAISSSLIFGYATRNQQDRNDWLSKQSFAKRVEHEGDQTVEEFLGDLSRTIAKDEFYSELFLQPQINKDLIEKKMRVAMQAPELSSYFADIYMYYPDGVALDSNQASMSSLIGKYFKANYATKTSNLYLVRDSKETSFKQYFLNLPIKISGHSLGWIVLQLKLRTNTIRSPFPNLLINNNNSDGSEVDKEYSYAIYFANERVFNFGNFNYSRNFKANYLEDKRLFESGLTISGFQHRAIKLRDNRVIVVSGLATPVKQLLANVCFIFIMLSAALLLWFLIRGISTNRLRNLSLTTKIQLYLNAAFLLPLLLISILAISVMSSSYLQDLQSGFQRQAEQIATSLLPNFEKTDGFLTSAQAPLDLYKVSLTTGQEMHLYGPSGVLMASSQPLLLKKQFMSSYVNPQALAAIVEARQNSTLQKESIGAISFTTAYAAIRNPESGAVIALVAVPFFESASQLNHQLSDVIGSMILLFTAMAFLFAILSFYASQQLVVPLRLLTKRIRRTSLERQILPLEWKSKDEIGLLVQEYNKMIANLSKSREVIIKSEKESAWREMARQVAHEIKNPLTPMKLTLQYLKQAIERNHVEVPKITERSINTLLIQIDTLNDIASSFSAFAQMPAPKDELLNLSKIIKDTVVLYSSNHETGVESSIPDMDVPARGDARLLSRIFTNLILNAYQSVPEDVVAQISVKMEVLDSGVARIAVEDNGSGISEIHKSRIFQPDFSTKNGGSGIGLAVAKRGIEHLGGKIWFESLVGGGTTFFIELPTLLSSSVVEQL